MKNCKCPKCRRERWRQLLWPALRCAGLALLFLALLGLLLVASGCGTVIPKTVQANVASYDGDAQNSGLLSTTTNSTGEVTGAIITMHARDRYNALIVIYSTNFYPALKFDAGITPLKLPSFIIVGKPPPLQTYSIDAEHLVDFMRMNRWHKAAAPPGILKP